MLNCQRVTGNLFIVPSSLEHPPWLETQVAGQAKDWEAGLRFSGRLLRDEGEKFRDFRKKLRWGYNGIQPNTTNNLVYLGVSEMGYTSPIYGNNGDTRMINPEILAG